MKKYDVCIIGSGAGAGPVAYTLSNAGFDVVILEKGGTYNEDSFSKDEIAYCRRDVLLPNIREEYHILEELQNGEWESTPTYNTNINFWNGQLLGGSSNLMSGFFHRLQEVDFKLLSRFGKIEGANIEDWPIDLKELEPYYKMVDEIVGVSGDDAPYEPTIEHPISRLFDDTAKQIGFNPSRISRAIITKQKENRDACYYSGYCGSYPCSSGAKGSSRASLINPALKNGNLTIIDNAFVFKLNSNKHSVTSAEYFDKNGKKHTINANIFVVSAQAIESARLLLNSSSTFFPNGLANNNGQVGKNLISSAGGIGSGEFDADILPNEELFTQGFFVNRALKDWYTYEGKKGGVIDFLFQHSNPIAKAQSLKWDEDGNLLWGEALAKKLYENFTKKRKMNFEVFNDWLPNDNSFVSVDQHYKDKYGIPVAKVRFGSHPHNMEVASFLAKKGVLILEAMGAKNIDYSISSYPSTNLLAGGCRFGDDPKKSVLDRNCKAHELDNLFVSDGSFMPTGGSVPFTYTIYANSFRIAEYIKRTIK